VTASGLSNYLVRSGPIWELTGYINRWGEEGNRKIWVANHSWVWRNENSAQMDHWELQAWTNSCPKHKPEGHNMKLYHHINLKYYRALLVFPNG
jgi:hypothetical protein